MRPGQIANNAFIVVLYVVFALPILFLLPLFTAYWFGRNSANWADRLSNAPGLKQGGGLSSAATGFLFGAFAWLVIFSVIGAVSPPEDSQNPGSGVSPGDLQATPSPRKSSNLISGPPDQLLPTIDDFDSDWREVDSDRKNKTIFFNTQTEAQVAYEVTIHNSTRAAKDDFSDRRRSTHDDGYGIDKSPISDQGFLYKPGDGHIAIIFREMNIVARSGYLGRYVLSPESNAKKFANRFHDNTVG